jgi:hypothetical protein
MNLDKLNSNHSRCVRLAQSLVDLHCHEEQFAAAFEDAETNRGVAKALEALGYKVELDEFERRIYVDCRAVQKPA